MSHVLNVFRLEKYWEIIRQCGMKKWFLVVGFDQKSSKENLEMPGIGNDYFDSNSNNIVKVCFARTTAFSTYFIEKWINFYRQILKNDYMSRSFTKKFIILRTRTTSEPFRATILRNSISCFFFGSWHYNFLDQRDLNPHSG